MSVKEELERKYGKAQEMDYSSVDSYKESMRASVEAAVGASPNREKHKQFDKQYNQLRSDTKKFLTAAEMDTSGENRFNAADYFEERKKQADALKKRADTLALFLQDNADFYSLDHYDSLMQNLSSFNTGVDDVMSRYQPSLDSKAGMRAYEDELRAAMDQDQQERDRWSKIIGFDLSRIGRDNSGDYAVAETWTPEQRYRLGMMQMEDPSVAREYAGQVNAGRDPYVLRAREESMDLEAEKREIDRLQAELDDFYWNADYDATSTNARNAFDQEVKRREKEISDRTQFYNQAKRTQEGIQFASATQRDDFATRSGYAGAGFEVPAFVEDADPDELTYEYINDPNIRTQINRQTNSLAAKGYDLLNEEEVGIYNYYYATEGPVKAQQYLDNIQDTLNKRIGERGAETKQGNIWKQLMAGAISGYSNAVTAPQYFFDKDSDYINTNPSQYMSAAIREDLADTGPVIPGMAQGASLGQIAFDLVNTTANMAPSILLSTAANAVLPGSGAFIGAATMGLSSAGGAYQQALNAGYSKKQSRAYAALSGASEAGMEYLLGGISKLGGEIPQKVLRDIVRGVDNAIAKAALTIGGDMVSEGFEEGLQEIITPWLENLVLYAEKDVNWDDVAYSTLLGALSGGVMEGPSVAVNTSRVSRVDKQLQNLGAKGNTWDLAELIVKHRSGEQLSQEDYIKLVKSKPAMQILEGMRNAEPEEPAIANMTAEQVEKMRPSTSKDGNARQISRNESINVIEFAEVKDGKATVKTDSGTVDYSDVSFGTEKQGNQYFAVESLPSIDTAHANELLKTIQTADVGNDTAEVVAIRESYRLGYMGAKTSELRGSDASILPTNLQDQIYSIGKEQRTVNDSIRATAAGVRAQATKGYKKVVIEGKLSKMDGKRKTEIDYMDRVADTFAGTAVHVYESYEKNGKMYYRDNSGKEQLAPNGKYVNDEIWVDLNSGDKGEGLVLNTFAHEMYHHIEKWNKPKARELAEFVVKELGLESVDKAVDEQIKKARAAGYGEKYFQDKQGMTAEQAQNEVYVRAMSDFVADSLETMFTRGDPTKAIANLKKENQGLFDQIKAFIDEWISKVKKFYSDKTISEEGAKVAQLEKFEQLQQLFMEAMQGAGVNYRDAKVEDEKSTTQEGDAMYSNRFEEDKYFARQIDRIGELKEGSYVTVGKIKEGSPIEQVGIPAGKLYFDVSKIRQEMIDRKDPIPATIIKDIPKVLDHPMLITEYVDRAGKVSINVYGKLYIGTSPVVIGIIIGKHRNGQSVDKIQTVHPNRHFLDEVTESNTLYLGENKKETNAWFQALGAQEPPLGGTKYGFIRSLTQSAPTVNTEMNSLRNQQPTTREILSQIDISTRKKTEAHFLGQYQENLSNLAEQEPRLAELNAQIKELYKDQKGNLKEITRLQKEQRQVNADVNRLKRLVNSFERSDMGKRLVTEVRAKARQEQSRAAMKSYKDEQKKLIESMQTEQRLIREELTGTQSVMSIMEDEFVRLAKDLEAKKIDLKTMEEKFLLVSKQYDKDTQKWLREYRSLMSRYRKLDTRNDKNISKIEQLEKTILQQRQTARAKVTSRRNTEMRHKIQRKANELNQLLIHGTKHRNIPEYLQPAVADILNAINMEVRDGDQRRATYEATLARYDRRIAMTNDPAEVSRLIEKRNEYAANGDQFANKMAKLKEAYQKIQDDKIPNMEIDEGLASRLMELFVVVGDTPLGQMTSEQLEAVNDVLNITKATIRNANEMLSEARSAGVVESSKYAIMEIKSAGETKKKKTHIRKVLEQFGWNNLKPIYAFDVIGSKTLKDRYEALRKGEDTLAVDLNEAKEFFQEQWKKNGGKEWDMEQKWKFTSTSGKSFELDLNQIMSLYALAKDKDARSHLRVGGFAFDSDYQTKEDINLGPVKIPVKVESTDASAYNLSDEILGEIISKLTPQQRAFADAMQAYLSDTMAEKGNEVSLKKYGIRLFKKKDYFPIRVADQFMAKAREQKSGDREIKNSGFTKDRKPEAKNPVVLSGFTEIWAEHVDEMSLYHSFVLPLDDFNRVLNYHDAFVEGEQAASVVEAITNAFGKGAVNYIDQLIKDVNGGIKGGSTVSFANSLVSKAKKAQTMASLSVAIQQPSSIIRAMSEVDTKYFYGPRVTEKSHDRTWDEIKKHAPIAIIKEMGGYDTNVGKSTVDYLTDTADYDGFGEKFKAMFTDEKFRDDALGRLPALMDEMSWGVIWNAVKREQRDRHPNMDTKSDAFMKLVANRFTEVITRTQVYDSVFSRSGLMRDRKSDLAKMITSFMAEPTTTANMLAVSILQASRGDIKGKQAAKTVGSIVASLALNSALVSVIYALRDDDEDKRYDEKWVENFRNNFFESLNPLGYIPYVRDIYNLFAKGYDVERADMELFGDLQNAIEGLGNEDITAWEKTENVIGSIGNLLGVPVKNILRDVKGFVQTIGFSWDDRPNPKTKTGTYMAWRGMDLTDKEQMILAIQSGDEEHLQRVFGRFESQQKAESALQSAIKAKYLEDGLTVEETEEMLSTYFDRDDEFEIYWLMEEWDYAKSNDGSTDGYTKYGSLYDAIETGEYETEIARFLEHGADASTIRSQITREYRKQYLEDETVREDIREKLRPVYEATGMYPDDIDAKFNDWDFEAEYGMTYGEFKAEYREGLVTETQMREAMKSYGLMQYEIAADIRSLNNEIKFVDKYDMTLSEMKDAYDNGDITPNQMRSALVFDGMTQKEAKAWVKQRDIENRLGIDYMEWDDAYKHGDISRQTFYNAMIENGTPQKDADDAILSYDWLKKHVNQYPDLASADGKKFAVRIHADYAPDETLEDYGVSIDAYIEYQRLRPECKGVDANGDGKTDDGTLRDSIFQMIDSLPITSEAKDGLALMSYSAKSIRRNAPWH